MTRTVAAILVVITAVVVSALAVAMSGLVTEAVEAWFRLTR